MKTILGGEEYLDLGAQIIKSGGVAAFPTETVYGLGADAFDASAVKKIFEAKGRPQDNPLIVHISSPEEINNVAKDIPEEAYILMHLFSPGPLTLVLKKADDLPYETTGGLNTVGIRIPRHPMALELIRRCGRPIAAPSANASGRISPTEAAHVYEDMNGRIPLILDGGKTEIGIESTVLDLTKEIPVILRPGAVTPQMLSSVLDKVISHKGEVIVAEAPGMKYKHYAPLCPAAGALTPGAAVKRYDQVADKNPVIIGSQDFIEKCGARRAIVLGGNPGECMSNLFSALRKAEKEHGYIILQYFNDDENNGGLNNRIKKAVGGNFID